MRPTIALDWTLHLVLAVIYAGAFAFIAWAVMVGHVEVLPLLLIVSVGAWIFVVKPMLRLPREHREQRAAVQAADDRWAEMRRRGIVPGP